MSRLYWHTRTWAAELQGSEYAWLRHLAQLQARAAWQLSDILTFEEDRVVKLLGWIGDDDRNYVHTRFDEYLVASKSETPGAGRVAGQLWRRLIDDLVTYLGVTGYWLTIDGHRVHTHDVGYNAALACGSRPIQLAAKLAGYGEVHCYVEARNFGWLATVIQEGLNKALYRATLSYRGADNVVIDVLPQGWEQVLELLNHPDDSPAVLSYSVTDSFPNPEVADFDVDDDVESNLDRWYRLSSEERWNLGVAGLRRRPWLELSPTTLDGTYFGPAVTPFDLWAPDAEERVRRACEAHSE